MPSGGSSGKRHHLAGSVKLVRRWHPSWFATNPSPECLTLTRTIDALSLPIRWAADFGQLLGEVEITTLSGKVVLRHAKVVGIVSTHELEEVAFTFQQIDWGSGNAGGAASQDNWSSYPP
jgi:hypothetical protein